MRCLQLFPLSELPSHMEMCTARASDDIPPDIQVHTFNIYIYNIICFPMIIILSQCRYIRAWIICVLDAPKLMLWTCGTGGEEVHTTRLTCN